MALLTWVTIFPLITVVVLALDPLLVRLDLFPRLAVTTAVTVPIMTWLVMPRHLAAARLALPAGLIRRCPPPGTCCG